MYGKRIESVLASRIISRCCIRNAEFRGPLRGGSPFKVWLHVTEAQTCEIGKSSSCVSISFFSISPHSTSHHLDGCPPFFRVYVDLSILDHQKTQFCYFLKEEIKQLIIVHECLGLKILSYNPHIYSARSQTATF